MTPTPPHPFPEFLRLFDCGERTTKLVLLFGFCIPGSAEEARTHVAPFVPSLCFMSPPESVQQGWFSLERVSDRRSGSRAVTVGTKA